ncbi:MAG: hypothetical protein JSV01_06610, partial [Desulfobacterales bacterium]
INKDAIHPRPKGRDILACFRKEAARKATEREIGKKMTDDMVDIKDASQEVLGALVDHYTEKYEQLFDSVNELSPQQAAGYHVGFTALRR